MRWLACWILALVLVPVSQGGGKDKTTADWLKALKDSKDAKEKQAALIVLELAPITPAIVEGVKNALAVDASPEVRREAAMLLGRMGAAAKETVSALGEALATDKEPLVKEAAARALGARLLDFSGSQVLVLGRALKDPSPVVRTAAAETLKSMRDKAREATRDLLAFVVEAQKDETVPRRFAIHAVSRFTDLSDKELDEIVGALNRIALDAGTAAEVREAALDGLGHLKSEKSVPGLVGGLKASEPELRRTAIRGLVQLKEKAKDGWSAIKTILKDRDGVVRNQAILACGFLAKGQPEAVDALIHAATKDFDLDNRVTAIQTLGSLGPVAASALKELDRLARDDVRARIRDAAREAHRKIQGS